MPRNVDEPPVVDKRPGCGIGPDVRGAIEGSAGHDMLPQHGFDLVSWDRVQDAGWCAH